jgi:hypothetical protein
MQATALIELSSNVTPTPFHASYIPDQIRAVPT